jgi:hypothetical protein
MDAIDVSKEVLEPLRKHPMGLDLGSLINRIIEIKPDEEFALVMNTVGTKPGRWSAHFLNGGPAALGEGEGRYQALNFRTPVEACEALLRLLEARDRPVIVRGEDKNAP